MRPLNSAARRPRRPGDARHDPAAIDETEALDDHHLKTTAAGPSPLPVLCQDALMLRARIDCPKCGRRTAAFALMGLPEFETEGGAVMLRRLSALPAEVDRAVRAFAGTLWRIDQSRAVKGSHWHSHCQHCGARIGEVQLHGANGPFRPRLYRERVAIKAKRLTGPFVFDGVRAALNPAMADWLAWFRQREDQQRATDLPRRAPPRAATRTPPRPRRTG